MKHQEGYIWKENGAWFGRWREDVLIDGRIQRKQRSKKLAEVGDRYRSKSDLRPLLDDELAKRGINSGSRAVTMQLGAFVREIYFPHIERNKHHSTVVGYKEKWKNHLEGRCSHLWIRDVELRDIQIILDSIARQNPHLGRATLARIKSLLSGIFKHATQQGLYKGANPARDTEIPKAHGASETYAYSLDEIKAMLAVTPDPTHAVIAVAAFSGLSKSEIEGLTWESYSGEELTVLRARVRGKFGDPKTPKRQASVPVILPLKGILDRYKLSVGNPSEGPIFKNGKGNPHDLNNLLTRTILPVLSRCGECHKQEDEHTDESGHAYKRDEGLPDWKGWHAFRRGLATNLHELGVPDVVIQRILRHSNVAVTQASYIKTRDARVVGAMKKFEKTVGNVVPFPIVQSLHSKKTARIQ